MSKKLEWRTKNRILVESGFKAFDNQADCLSIGNVFANVQVSSFIRAFSDTACNKHEFPIGELRAFDLRPFGRIPVHVLKKVKELTQDKSIILYKFRHWRKKEEVVDGYVLTSAGPEYNLMGTFYTGPTHKSQMAVDEAIKYVTT